MMIVPIDGRRRRPRSAREVARLALPLSFAAALDEDEEILDGAPYRQALAHGEDAGHRETLTRTRVGVVRQRREIVREQDPAFLGGSLEARGIGRSRQTDLLGANDVDAGPTT